jgi:hypothetical protein
MLVAACDSNGGGTGTTFSSTTLTTASRQPLTPPALADLLLSAAEIDSVLGITGSRTDKLSDALEEAPTVNPGPNGRTFPDECLYISGPALALVYANSGNTVVHGEQIAAPSPGSNAPAPHANQFVVLFPTAEQASAFFATSSQHWPACANRQDTVPGRDAASPGIQWKVGPVSNANGVLSTTVSVSLSKNGETKSQSCQRALTVRNNVVIDVDGCRTDPGNAGVTIANQIADKVDKQ